MLFIHMLASFGIAVLSGMGVGSAGLFVLYLTAFAGLSQLQAQGLNPPEPPFCTMSGGGRSRGGWLPS